MDRRLWSWVKGWPWGAVVTAAVGFLLAYAATRLLDWGIENQSIRDIAITVVVIASIIGFYAVVIWSPWRRPQMADTGLSSGTEPEQESLRVQDEPELIQFIKAWFIPAWEKARDLLVRIRGEVRRIEGERIEALLQAGIIDPVVSSRNVLRDRLQGEGTQSIDSLLADAYRKYELMVRWLWHGSEKIKRAVIVDSQDFTDWQIADDKLLDHLCELIANPQLHLQDLTDAFREIEQGGVAKSVRLNLKKEALKLAQQ